MDFLPTPTCLCLTVTFNWYLFPGGARRAVVVSAEAAACLRAVKGPMTRNTAKIQQSTADVPIPHYGFLFGDVGVTCLWWQRTTGVLLSRDRRTGTDRRPLLLCKGARTAALGPASLGIHASQPSRRRWPLHGRSFVGSGLEPRVRPAACVWWAATPPLRFLVRTGPSKSVSACIRASVSRPASWSSRRAQGCCGDCAS